MSARFAFNITTLLAAGFLVVVSMAFSPGVAGWIAFGVSTGIAVAGIAGLALARAPGDRAGQVAIIVLGLWSLAAALAFSGTALTWLVFADAAAVAVLSLAQLAGNEAAAQRALGAAQHAGPGRVRPAA